MPDIGRRQRRRVVHAVADHRHRPEAAPQLSTAATLSSGSSSARTSSTPSCARDRLRGAVAVAGEHDERSARRRRRSRSIASRPASRGRSATTMMPDQPIVAATSTAVRPAALDRVELARASPASRGRRSSNRRWLPRITRAPPTRPRRRARRAPSTPSRRRHRDLRRTRHARGSRARSDARSAARPTPRAPMTAAAPTPFERARRPTTSGAPRVSVPVLSNATQRTRLARSRCAPPLISTPFARRAGERRDDRHRRRNHERARARHDQQHQRAVEPRRATAAAEDQRRHDRRRRRERDDGGGVDARKPLDQRLRRARAAPAPARPGG